ncbi:hypothetical protein ACFYY3_01090 [Streptomyces sp. NPDC001812]|uniref:hypothetical protein n=1 Tax=Streptomyces sp. NPDC001812 TaxID=3364611 RepID=UPI00368D9744
MSGERPVEVLVYEVLRARLDGDEARAHLLVRRLSRRDLMEFTKALAGVTLESLTEILRASGHADPEGFIRNLLERASEQAVDAAIAAQVFEDPPPFER